MKKYMLIYMLFCILSCDKNTGDDIEYVGAEQLEGYWVNVENEDSFLHFYSLDEGRTGSCLFNSASFDSFKYEVNRNILTIDFLNETNNILWPIEIENDTILKISYYSDVTENKPVVFIKHNRILANENPETFTDTVEVRLSEPYFNCNKKIGLEVVAIASDTRCPQDTTCSFVGEVSLHFRYTDAYGVTYFKLANSSFNNGVIKIHGVDIKLLNVLPLPYKNDPVKLEEIIAVVEISK